MPQNKVNRRKDTVFTKINSAAEFEKTNVFGIGITGDATLTDTASFDRIFDRMRRSEF